jgi:hypothetical protein
MLYRVHTYSYINTGTFSVKITVYPSPTPAEIGWALLSVNDKIYMLYVFQQIHGWYMYVYVDLCIY